MIYIKKKKYEKTDRKERKKFWTPKIENKKEHKEEIREGNTEQFLQWMTSESTELTDTRYQKAWCELSNGHPWTEVEISGMLVPGAWKLLLLEREE